MNGARSLVETLLRSGVDTCCANPGTSELHFVAALDREPVPQKRRQKAYALLARNGFDPDTCRTAISAALMAE